LDFFFFVIAFELMPVVWPADGVFGLPLVVVSMFCPLLGLPAPGWLLVPWALAAVMANRPMLAAAMIGRSRMAKLLGS
jgi:hypothetical protein